ncbi:hypothetical protein [Rhodococcus opacus]|uniref:hypothetical protein n=1 Tax=Rhodococcus opacus TaxID=37919 RepID=UPI001C20C2D0|nr:hypothetical protein [Rhodococcus opacus]
MANSIDLATTVTALVGAHAAYPSREGGSYYDEVLAEVQARAHRSGSIGKADIGALMLWKRLNLSTKWARELNDTPDHEVRYITGPALELARDTGRSIPDAAEAARTELLDLAGCRNGAAIASTILTAGAPSRMAIYDRRAVAALVALGFPNPDGYYSRYMATICGLVDLVNNAEGTSWVARDVDKALFMMAGSVDRGQW